MEKLRSHWTGKLSLLCSLDLHIYFFPFVYIERSIHFVEILYIAPHLVLGPCCVERHAHVFDALTQELLARIQVLQNSILLLTGYAPGGVGFAFVHHYFILCSLSLCRLFLSELLEVGRDLALGFGPCHWLLFFFFNQLVCVFDGLFLLFDNLFVLFDVMLLVCHLGVLGRFELLSPFVALGALQLFC